MINNVRGEENFIDQVKIITSKGCFNLRGWESNIACKFVSKYSGIKSLFGMLGSFDKDKLKSSINTNMLTCDVKGTKRLLPSTVQSIFNSIGILDPITLLSELILQKKKNKKFIGKICCLRTL